MTQRIDSPGAARTDVGRRPLNGGVARAVVVVFAGLLTLQSSEAFDAGKVAYLAVAAVATVWSIAAVLRRSSHPIVAAGRPWLALSVVIVLIIGLSLPVAQSMGTALTDWLRDSAAYLLLAAAPWLALDAAISASPRAMTATLGVAGALSVVSFTIEWLERRNLADLPLDRLTLPSFFLAAAFYCLTWALAMSAEHRRWVWLLVGAGALGLILMTGTRSTATLLIAPLLGALLLARSGQWGRVVTHAATGAAQVTLAVVIVLGGQGLAAGFDSGSSDGPGDASSDPPPGTTDRLDTIDDVVRGTDNSLRERMAQTKSALDAFGRSPLLGTGPGYPFRWLNYAGEPRETFTLDTPFVVLAKFGLGGLVLLGGLILVYGRFVARLWRRGPWTVPALTAAMFGAVALVWLPLGWPVEDKGFSLALILLLAAGFAAIESPALPPSEGASDPDPATITGDEAA